MARIRFKLIIISALIILPNLLIAQDNGFINGFSMRVSPGILSFHGDLSESKFNPVDIVRDNSKFGFSLTALKEFNPLFGVQAQYAAGNLNSISEEQNQYFSGSLGEFSVSARLTPLGFFPDLGNRLNIQPYLTAGLGSFAFRNCRRYIDTDTVIPDCMGYENDGVTKTSRKHSLVIPLGIGVSVPINQNLAIDLDHTFRVTNTDMLDGSNIVNDNNDSYSITSLGLKFTIQPPQPAKPRPIKKEPEKPFEIEEITEQRPIQKDGPLNIFVESLMDDVVAAGDAMSVNLRINKGTYTGPAKLVQRYPDGFEALEASSTNGRFSFSNRNVLIEWDNMPVDSILAFTYYVRLDESVSGSQTITGRFEYEEKNKWNTVRFNNYIFADNRIDLKNEDQTKDLDLNPVDEQQQIQENQANKAVKDNKLDNELNIDPLILKDPKDDIEFRIQCGAFKDSNQGGKKLVERYGITEDMREVYENGWYKYTVGSFDSYVEAVNFKNSFIKRTKLFQAFVVAYKNGKRVANINDAFK